MFRLLPIRLFPIKGCDFLSSKQTLVLRPNQKFQMGDYNTVSSGSPKLLFRQLFEKESSTYTYLLADANHPDKPALFNPHDGSRSDDEIGEPLNQVKIHNAFHPGSVAAKMYEAYKETYLQATKQGGTLAVPPNVGHPRGATRNRQSPRAAGYQVNSSWEEYYVRVRRYSRRKP